MGRVYVAVLIAAIITRVLVMMGYGDVKIFGERKRPCIEWTYYHADSKVAAFKTAEPPTLMPNPYAMRAECTARAP